MSSERIEALPADSQGDSSPEVSKPNTCTIGPLHEIAEKITEDITDDIEENVNYCDINKTTSNNEMTSQDNSSITLGLVTVDTVNIINVEEQENNRDPMEDNTDFEKNLDNINVLSRSDLSTSQVPLQILDKESAETASTNDSDTQQLKLVSFIINDQDTLEIEPTDKANTLENSNKFVHANSNNQAVADKISPDQADTEIEKNNRLSSNKDSEEEEIEVILTSQSGIKLDIPLISNNQIPSNSDQNTLPEFSNCQTDASINTTELNQSCGTNFAEENVNTELRSENAITDTTGENKLKRNLDFHDETADTIPQKLLKAEDELYAEDTGPKIYVIKGNIVTPPIITRNLAKVFQDLPIHGKPESKSKLEEFYEEKIREFVGCGMDDDEYKELQKYCSPNNLKVGNELVMRSNYPSHNILPETNEDQDGENLATVMKHKIRVEADVKGIFLMKLKYRSVRVIPFPQEDHANVPSTSSSPKEPEEPLEPGKDILYIVRVYRPYFFVTNKERNARSRHSVLCYNVILNGRQKLTALRDRFVCHNDFDMRVDVSNNPEVLPKTKAKEIFPSGFLFINNVFYVDTREGCIDYTDNIREWALARGLGAFEKRDMCQTRMEDLVVKLGHPDVYMHQGNCEHVFLFSELRLVSPSDPLRPSLYPCTTAVGLNQTVYCTTCAEFCAKWIVTGCSKVLFDPTFFCDTCFKQYLYIDGEKVCDFKAYSYRGNALNVLKPQ